MLSLHDNVVYIDVVDDGEVVVVTIDDDDGCCWCCWWKDEEDITWTEVVVVAVEGGTEVDNKLDCEVNDDGKVDETVTELDEEEIICCGIFALFVDIWGEWFGELQNQISIQFKFFF